MPHLQNLSEYPKRDVIMSELGICVLIFHNNQNKIANYQGLIWSFSIVGSGWNYPISQEFLEESI